MAIIYARQAGHSFSSIHHHEREGWNYCMNKPVCKWPAIAGIVIAVVVILLTAFCCLKCCCGCFGGRGRKKNKNNEQSFIPAPYRGYQNANDNIAPPAYGQQPAQFAQFETPGNKKVTAGKAALRSQDNMN